MKYYVASHNYMYIKKMKRNKIIKTIQYNTKERNNKH